MLNNEIKAKKADLKNIEGYRLISKRVKQFLIVKPIIEKLLLSFKNALERFKEE